MVRSALWLFAAIMLAGASPAGAADAGRTEYIPAPALMSPPAPALEPAKEAKPLLPPPNIRYGCQRVWRCDKTVCEWRRGCWGVYGYVEGPYYTSEFAKRQWENHNLGIVPQKRRKRRR